MLTSENEDLRDAVRYGDENPIHAELQTCLRGTRRLIFALWERPALLRNRDSLGLRFPHVTKMLGIRITMRAGTRLIPFRILARNTRDEPLTTIKLRRLRSQSEPRLKITSSPQTLRGERYISSYQFPMGYFTIQSLCTVLRHLHPPRLS